MPIEDFEVFTPEGGPLQGRFLPYMNETTFPEAIVPLLDEVSGLECNVEEVARGEDYVESNVDQCGVREFHSCGTLAVDVPDVPGWVQFRQLTVTEGGTEEAYAPWSKATPVPEPAVTLTLLVGAMAMALLFRNRS
jgi:hypothetical protein